MKKQMDGWMDKKMKKNRWMVGWIKKIMKKNMDGWMDKKYMKNIMVDGQKKRWMVGWIEKIYEKKWMVGWMEKKMKKIDGWLDGWIIYIKQMDG